MANIHGSAYLVIGIFMVAFSFMMNYRKLAFFIICGFVFILVGMLKIFREKDQSTSQNHKLVKERVWNHPGQTHAQHQQHKLDANRQTYSVKHCAYCNNILGFHDSRCAYCGSYV